MNKYASNWKLTSQTADSIDIPSLALGSSGNASQLTDRKNIGTARLSGETEAVLCTKRKKMTNETRELFARLHKIPIFET
eukprot:GAHX01003080.1.p1 GENE.GAHX01003080.1~~GAHX01003080.1.p1  ORF type:complete len:80 (+),score=9.45 GAHX01003080.1:609-848(+)